MWMYVLWRLIFYGCECLVYLLIVINMIGNRGFYFEDLEKFNWWF